MQVIFCLYYIISTIFSESYVPLPEEDIQAYIDAASSVNPQEGEVERSANDERL